MGNMMSGLAPIARGLVTLFSIVVATFPVLAGAQTEPPRTAFVHLFEWRWNDVANECTYLGEKGYAAVQVSPPNEHVQGLEWWTRYQPVSYIIESRSGDRAAFQNMVERCHENGVKIYVDAVINHTADRESSTGVAGTGFTRKNHPNPGYAAQHYHAPCDIEDVDYRASQHKIQNCELVNLPDLDTGNNVVRQNDYRLL